MPENSSTQLISTRRLCFLALAIILNIVGGQIALLLHLPIYLDSMGTILIAVLFGPLYGMLPPLLYGLVMGFTIDIYSLYYMPVGLILGLVTGLAGRSISVKKWRIAPDHPAGHHRQLDHHSFPLWRDHLLRVHDPRTGPEQGRTWPYGKCFCCSVPDRLYRQADLPCFYLLSAEYYS